MVKAVNFGVIVVLLLGVLNTAYAEVERCVPAANGTWHCGKNVTEADAAPLPEPQSRSLPPVMLIDPARFGEGDIEIDSPPVTAAAEPAAESATAESAEDAPANAPPAVADAEASSSNAQAEMAYAASVSGNYSVQLAVAKSPRGFDALLAKIGPAARNSQRRLLANGSWVLLIGSFNSMAQARDAIPSGIPGAFARDISTLNFK